MRKLAHGGLSYLWRRVVDAQGSDRGLEPLRSANLLTFPVEKGFQLAGTKK